ncbi:MAG TPA: glycosyltransferase family 39 protein [Candidatus Eisenbacteria bacterium]|nr:glycosyltransferase family 39 protein [Candidatus Eisenbacteria bacterium]
MNIKDKSILLILIPICVIFLLTYSWLSFTSQEKFTSPDENVNLFFIEKYSQTGKLSYYEPLNKITFGYTRPRNSVSVGDKVVPNGFTGMYVVYGTIATIIPQAILFITPLLSILGGLFLFVLTSAIFNKKVALISVLLLFTLPPYWFWSSMSMFNNVPATVFFIGGIGFLLQGFKKNRFGFYLASALCFGLNEFFRFTDIIYLLPTIALCFFFKKQLNIKYLSIALIFYVMTIMPIFLINKELFGNFLSFGYTQSNSTPGNFVDQFLGKIRLFLLPSGFHPDRIESNFFNYFISYIPFASLLVLFGILYELFVKETKEVKFYVIYYLILSAWILIYYGSGIYWGINNFSMDASYIRYFLPIYIMAIPIVSNTLFSLHKTLSLFFIVAMIIISVLNTNLLKSGLVDIKKSRDIVYAQSVSVTKVTERNSIIITTMSDKILFPERKVVIYGPGYDANNFKYKTLVEIVLNLKNKGENTYILNDRNDLDIKKLVTLLESHKISLREINGFSGLYKIYDKS